MKYLFGPLCSIQTEMLKEGTVVSHFRYQQMKVLQLVVEPSGFDHTVVALPVMQHLMDSFTRAGINHNLNQINYSYTNLPLLVVNNYYFATTGLISFHCWPIVFTLPILSFSSLPFQYLTSSFPNPLSS